MKIAIIIIGCLVAAAVISFFAVRAVKKAKLRKKVEADTGVKIKRRTPKEWLRAHMPSKRRLIQLYATLLYNANLKGYIKGEIYTSPTTKYMCVPGLNCYSCPGAVGACPLGAFQNALAESSVRAPYYVLGILALFGLVFARTICGFLCPVGFGQELLYKIRTPKLKKNRVTRVCSYFKYVLLAVLVVIIPIMYSKRNTPMPGFCKYICPAGTLGGAIGLLINPKNSAMFSMLGGQFTWKFVILVVFIVASIFIYRFFCRFFCPLGAIYGFFNKIALIGVKVDKDNCTDCGKCVTVCKMDIKRVGDHECINCGECIPVCPTKAISWKGSKFFLHKSAIDEKAGDEKPLDIARAVPNPVAVQPAIVADAMQMQASAAVPMQTDAASGDAAVCEKKREKRTAAFWVKLSAVILAVAVLIGALVYYNFIDVEKKAEPLPDVDGREVGYEVGMTAPDFTVKLYGSDGNFNLYENRGKLTVINFWATWCMPCVNEIPYFNELTEKMPDINVIAIHGSSTRDVQEFIESKWSGYSLSFAQDNISGTDCLTYKLLGGKRSWPLTVILNAEGIVLYNSTNSFHSYAQLEELINSFTSAE